jgi:hypothetical protein
MDSDVDTFTKDIMDSSDSDAPVVTPKHELKPSPVRSKPVSIIMNSSDSDSDNRKSKKTSKSSKKNGIHARTMSRDSIDSDSDSDNRTSKKASKRKLATAKKQKRRDTSDSESDHDKPILKSSSDSDTKSKKKRVKKRQVNGVGAKQIVQSAKFTTHKEVSESEKDGDRSILESSSDSEVDAKIVHPLSSPSAFKPPNAGAPGAAPLHFRLSQAGTEEGATQPLAFKPIQAGSEGGGVAPQAPPVRVMPTMSIVPPCTSSSPPPPPLSSDGSMSQPTPTTQGILSRSSLNPRVPPADMLNKIFSYKTSAASPVCLPSSTLSFASALDRSITASDSVSIRSSTPNPYVGLSNNGGAGGTAKPPSFGAAIDRKKHHALYTAALEYLMPYVRVESGRRRTYEYPRPAPVDRFLVQTAFNCNMYLFDKTDGNTCTICCLRDVTYVVLEREKEDVILRYPSLLKQGPTLQPCILKGEFERKEDAYGHIAITLTVWDVLQIADATRNLPTYRTARCTTSPVLTETFVLRYARLTRLFGEGCLDTQPCVFHEEGLEGMRTQHSIQLICKAPLRKGLEESQEEFHERFTTFMGRFGFEGYIITTPTHVLTAKSGDGCYAWKRGQTMDVYVRPYAVAKYDMHKNPCFELLYRSIGLSAIEETGCQQRHAIDRFEPLGVPGTISNTEHGKALVASILSHYGRPTNGTPRADLLVAECLIPKQQDRAVGFPLLLLRKDKKEANSYKTILHHMVTAHQEVDAEELFASLMKAD